MNETKDKIMVYILRDVQTHEITSTLNDLSDRNIGDLIISDAGEFILINKTEIEV